MQVQELVGIVPWNFIATICNLFIQVYLIKRFLFKPINEMLEKRKAKADAQIQDAVKAKEEAQAMKAEYEKNMQEAKNRANDIVMTAQKTAAIQSEEMLKEASSQVTAMKEKAEKDIAQEKRKAVNEIKGEIGGMAVDIAGKVIIMTKTARVYGGSLYDLAAEEKLDGQIMEQMIAVRQIFRENPGYLKLLGEPAIPEDERLKMIEEAFGGQAERYLVNFLKLLCERKILREFAGSDATTVHMELQKPWLPVQ